MSQLSGRGGRLTLGMALGVALLGVAIAVRATSAHLSWGWLPDRLQDFLTLSLSVIVESLPFVFLGILLSIVVQVWLPENWIARHLPRTPWLRRAAISLIGMLLPVCECGNVPLSRGLMMRGFTVPESMTFLLAAPILNPITIITTHQAFGWDGSILAARLVGGLVIANLVGWLYSRHPEPSRLLTDRFAAACESGGHAHGGRLTRSAAQFGQEAGDMLPALFVGGALAGLIQVVIPRETLIALGSNPVWSVLAMMALAFVVAICSNVDAFFALSFASTFLPGGIVAFLLFGPLIDVKMLALMRTTFRASTLVQLTLIVGLVSAVFGLGVNALAT